MMISILYLFHFTVFPFLGGLKMHFSNHLLKFPIEPSLKVVHLRREGFFDWSNMAAALHQFFGTACHTCVEVSVTES